jgi:CYTH domain-containing protein
MAEVELTAMAPEPEMPSWAYADVTEDDRYANSYLQTHGTGRTNDGCP